MTSALTVPNIITLARIAAVPLLAFLLLSGHYAAAFWLFVIAGISDAFDGIIARWFDQGSALGAWLDPLADKALLVTTFVLLALVGLVPAWLVGLMVLRDIFILVGVMTIQVFRQKVEIRPLFVSKATTAAQILLVAVVLAGQAFGIGFGVLEPALVWVTAGLTAASFASYGMVWMRHMGAAKDTPGS